MHQNRSHPFPTHLLIHWLRSYLLLWFFLGLVIFLVQIVLSAVLHEREDVVHMIRMLDRLPKIFKAFIGGDELMASNVTSIIAIGYQHPLILISLMINSVVIPSGLLTAQMEQGRLELLLSRQVTRTQILVCTIILSLLSQVFLVTLLPIGTYFGTNLFDYGESIPIEGFVHIAINLFAMAASTAALSTLGAVILNERNKVIGCVTGYLVGSYLLDFTAVWLPSIEKIHPFTFFYYYSPNAILKAETIPWAQIGVLGIFSLISYCIAFIYWRRRDLYTA